MITTIQITDDFEQLEAEYKRFKNIIFNTWCEFDQYVLDSEEKNLIQSISLILQDTEGNKEENLIRALIGARVLSKYSNMNQKDCVNFYPKSDSPFPQSIQKRRFILKSIAKKCRLNTSYEWYSYILTIQNKILPMNIRIPAELESTENALIYIDFLIQYAPDFVSKFSNEIFLHLLQIIKKNEYTFDLTYDIFSKTNQTQDQYFSNETKFFANNAIELLRKILLNIKSIRYQSIDIEDILDSDDITKIKKLAVLSVLLESCGKTFLKQSKNDILSFLKSDDDDLQNKCLITRNLIFCLGYDTTSRDKLIENHFSFSPTLDSNIICAMLQNLKLLITNDHDTAIQHKIFDIAISFINNQEIKHNVFDILNTFCLVYDEKESNNLIFKSKYVDQIFDTIHFEFNELAKSMIFYDQKLFIEQLSNLITNSPFETLLFLNNNRITKTDENEYSEFSIFSKEEEEDNCIIEELKSQKTNDFKTKIINPIFGLAENDDSRIRSLVPLVLTQICPEEFLSKEPLEKFISRLLADPSNEVKLALLQSFNYILNQDDETLKFDNLKEKLDGSTCETIFKPLLDDISPQNIRIEAIKFISLMAKRRIREFYYIKKHIIFYNKFTNPANNIALIQRKLASSSQFLPYIFKTFTSLNEDDYSKFYDFAIDFLNIATKNKTNYQNQTALKINSIPKTLFQLKFYETTFCSFIKTIKLLFKIKPEIIQSHVEELINLCLTNLYYGITEPETLYTLSLLEQCLYYIGLEKTIEINNQNIFDTNLYQIVFNTGAHFISPLISKLVFRILGFIGGHFYDETEKSNNSIPEWKLKLNSQLYTLSLDNHRRQYFYSVCSELLFKVLEDESMTNSHFNALTSLINIQKRVTLGDLSMTKEFKRSFTFFQKLLNSTSIKAKDGFVPLLNILIGFSFKAIQKSIPDLIQSLIDLWDYGSSSILANFASILKLNLSPYLNQIVPLVISLQNPAEIVKLLVSLYRNVVFNVNGKKIFFFDIINLLLQMNNEGKYEALDGLNQLIPILIDLQEYVPPIVDACLANISHLTTNDNNNSAEEEALEMTCLNDTTKVLNTLLLNSKNSKETSEIFDIYRSSIIESLGPFPDKLNEFTENVEKMRDKEIKKDVNFPNKEEKSLTVTDYLKSDFNEFINFVTSIDKYIDNEVNSIYVQQWLDELILYCIQNSPSYTIRKTFQIAKTNPSFAISIFNIAFYSMINHKPPRPVAKTQTGGKSKSSKPPPKKNNNKSHIKINGDPRTKVAAPKKEKVQVNKNEMIQIDGKKQNCPPPNQDGDDPPEMPIQMAPNQNRAVPTFNRIQPITKTFLQLLQMEKMPLKCKSIILNLIAFMDRANAPIIKIEDLKNTRPITSLFADNPPLSLLFSLRQYENNKSIEKEKKKAQVNLERAFLNAGLIDQYHHFVRINKEDTNLNLKNDDNDYDSFTLPIFANTIENIHYLKKANDFFLNNEWDKFNEHIDQSDREIISHLFKTAFLIQNYWNSNNEIDNLTNNDFIYNYIDHNEDENYEEKLKILKEIELGFDALGHEIGSSFTQGNASSFQSIIYGQQLVELQELFFSNGKRNDFILRFLDSDQISSFLHHILLLRIAAKGQKKDSLPEKNELFKLCRKASKWDLMNKYFNYFYKSNSQVPVEIQYEMLHYKNATNEAKESDFINLFKTVIEMKDEKYNELLKHIKYQKAVYHAHSFNDKNNYGKVIKLCSDNDDADAINLWSWANLKIYRIGEEKKEIYLKEAIKGYIKSSIKSEKMRVSNMITIISLLFGYFVNRYDINNISKELNQLPLYFYIDCSPQIISHIHKLNENDKLFNEFMYKLLIELMSKYPHGVIYEYMFSIFCDDREIDHKIIKSPIVKVRDYFLQNREILEQSNARNIFYQAFELTNNLYRVASDIKAIMYNFTRYVSSFIGEELIAPHSKHEINDFIKNLEYMNKEYCIPLRNYIEQSYGKTYEPNATEKADICNENLTLGLKTISILVENIRYEYINLMKLRKRQRDNYDKLQKKRIKHHQQSFKKHLKTKLNPQPRKQKKDLSSSNRVTRAGIMIDVDEINEDKIKQDEESSDLIENQPLVSLPYGKKDNLPTLCLFDKSDSVENNIAIEPKRKENQNNSFVVKRSKSEVQRDIDKICHASFNINFPPSSVKLIDKIMKLEKLEEKNQKDISFCLRKLKSNNSGINSLQNKLYGAIKASSTQFNVLVESPKMEGMVNLCLPVFGTYHHDQDPILISKFVSKCQSFQSLARPKVINIIGNNGVKYTFMLKASEDLRADQRFMLFFNFLNRFIKTKIRTYSVTPLTVRFGVMEFVNNTTTLSDMIDANRAKEKATKNCERVFICNNLNSDTYIKEDPYDSLTYIQHYEILNIVNKKFTKRAFDLRNSMWLIAPNSETWIKYLANFNKYCAVTSIVGYIIGIGDRHNANIMFDTTNGSLVHIDFTDCFEFDQQRIKHRERVPFRLTKNIVAALGPCGVNGTFRSCCEETLAIIRENREIIYSILEVFSTSPIYQLGMAKNLQRSDKEIKHSQKMNEIAMQRIEKKLNGTDRAIIYDRDNLNKISDGNEVPLSVQEHVDRLINIASNEYFISSSYHGWRPFV